MLQETEEPLWTGTQTSSLVPGSPTRTRRIPNTIPEPAAPADLSNFTLFLLEFLPGFWKIETLLQNQTVNDASDRTGPDRTGPD